MRTCVIFNPTAKGDKARRFRQLLSDVGRDADLKPTTGPGAAQELARQSVAAGYECVIAAGGDGTLNEVVNGIGDVDDGFERVRVGVLPLGTVNVFAREIRQPLTLRRAWEGMQRGNETRVDLACAAFEEKGVPRKRFFIQMAGAGFDARAVEHVNWPLKKRIGSFAYIIAGFGALRERQSVITVDARDRSDRGELVLVGNGRFYGGSIPMFPRADLRDGVLDVRVFPKLRLSVVLSCLWGLAIGRLDHAGKARHFQADSLKLSADGPTPFQLDGELVGTLPVEITLKPEALRLITP